MDIKETLLKNTRETFGCTEEEALTLLSTRKLKSRDDLKKRLYAHYKTVVELANIGDVTKRTLEIREFPERKADALILIETERGRVLTSNGLFLIPEGILFDVYEDLSTAIMVIESKIGDVNREFALIPEKTAKHQANKRLLEEARAITDGKMGVYVLSEGSGFGNSEYVVARSAKQALLIYAHEIGCTNLDEVDLKEEDLAMMKNFSQNMG